MSNWDRFGMACIALSICVNTVTIVRVQNRRAAIEAKVRELERRATQYRQQGEQRWQPLRHR